LNKIQQIPSIGLETLGVCCHINCFMLHLSTSMKVIHRKKHSN